ncbi:MAG TPA: hypothetical protein VEM37_00145 [Nitrospiraceae bacterium]|nr:hypothetical protein [Nitrospiraceae bacterium]
MAIARLVRLAVALAVLLPGATHTWEEAPKKTNILVIFGDDIGVTNVSAYSQGLVGYRTPNIDRIAREA